MSALTYMGRKVYQPLLSGSGRPHGDDLEIAARAAALGLSARPLSPHFVGRVTDHGLFLGFAAWNAREIEQGAEILGRVLRGRGG